MKERKKESRTRSLSRAEDKRQGRHRPLPWKVTVGQAVHKGEVVVARRWSTDLGEIPADEESEFLIIILATPHRLRAGSIKDPRVAVWAPSQAIAEEAVIYRTGKGKEELEALATLINSGPYRQGPVYTNRGLTIRTARTLTRGGMKTALDLLSAIIMINAAREYVLPIAGELPAPTTTENLETFQRAFLQSLERMRQGLHHARAALTRLSQQLSSTLDGADEQSLERLFRLAEARDAVSLARIARGLYARPSELVSDMEAYQRLEQLSRLESEVISVHSYLNQASPGRVDEELTVDMMSIKKQLNLAELAARPHLWSSIQDMFRWFKSRYGTLYLKHHREYYRGIEGLYDALKHARLQIEALNRLNSIRGLGTPLAEDVPKQYGEMLARLEPCPYREVPETALEARATCPDCDLALSSIPPSSEGQEYLRQLRDALEEQCRRLSLVAAKKILAGKAEGKLEQLIKVAQVSDLTSLVNVLDDELAEFLRHLLRETAP